MFFVHLHPLFGKKTEAPKVSKPLILLVFASGFEPLAFRLGGGRSILLSYANMTIIIYRLFLIGKYNIKNRMK